MRCWKFLLRSGVLALLLAGCASGGQDAPGGSGGEGGGATGGTVTATGGNAGVATGGASAGSVGTGGTPAPDASSGAPDAELPADSAAPKTDRPPMSNGPGKIVLVAGGGNGGDGSPAVMASTNRPFGVVVDPLN